MLVERQLQTDMNNELMSKGAIAINIFFVCNQQQNVLYSLTLLLFVNFCRCRWANFDIHAAFCYTFSTWYESA